MGENTNLFIYYEITFKKPMKDDGEGNETAKEPDGNKEGEKAT